MGEKISNFTCGCIIKYKRSLIFFFRQQLDNGLSETFFGGGGSGKTMSPSSPTFQDERNMEPVFSGRGFIPPRNGWKWWRYHEMGDHEILDHLLNVQHYDRRETPPSQSKSILYGVFDSIFGNIKRSQHAGAYSFGFFVVLVRPFWEFSNF